MTIHVVHFSGRVNAVASERIMQTCLDALTQDASEIWLHFASGGGQTIHGFTLYNFLRSLPVPLVTHNVSNVESISVIVFLAGQSRRVCPQGRFLIHPLNWSFEAGTVDDARLREYVRKLDNDIERFAEIFDERTARAAKAIPVRDHLSGQEKLISAEASLKAGIVHEVAEASIPKGAITWSVSTQ